MTPHDALQRFVDDELMRAPLLAEQVIEEAIHSIRSDGATLSVRERNLVGDVQRAVTLHRPLMVREFVRALTEHVQRELSGGDSTRHPLPSSLGGLSLVDETQVEVDVEVSRAIESIRNVAEHELREIMSYTSALVGDMDVARDYNPFRPEALARALWEAAQAIPLHRSFQLAFMRHACMPLAHLVRKTYAGACARLEQQGVRPADYRTIIVFGSRRAQGQQDSFFDPQANRAESSMPLPGPGGRPPGMGSASAGTTRAAATAAPAGAPTPAAQPPAAAAPRQTVEQVLSRTDELLRQLPADSSPRQREHLRTLQQRQLEASAERAADRELIDLVGRLFDAVLGNRRLDPDLQNLLARLQAPATRLALRDPSMLDNYTHPVWLLMDRMALQGQLHPPQGDPERTHMLRFLHGLLDTVTQEQARDADAFRWARERVLAYERTRFEQRRAAVDAELHTLQSLEDQVMAGGPPPTSPGALDVGGLDTVPSELLDDLSASTPASDPLPDAAQWLQSRRSGEWVHMFMQGAWVDAQLMWYGRQREYWLFADGASSGTWAVRRGALDRMLQAQLLGTLTPRSLIREAASRVLRNLGER